VTLSERLDPRHNSLNLIRLVLATAVICSHSWPAGGYGDDPGLGGTDLGDWAVGGFFAISGYLITMSRGDRSRSLLDFFVKRVLRIFPAFLVALLAVAFVAGPLSVVVDGSGSYDWGSATGYVVHNSLLQVRQWGIDGTLTDAPFPDVWNASAWTLYYEFLCYVGIGVLVSVVPRRWLTPAVVVGLVGCTVVTAAAVLADVVMRGWIADLAHFGTFFAAGALLFLLRDRVPLRGPLAAASGAAVVVIIVAGGFEVFAALPLAYLMLYLGAALPFQRIGRTHDLSYGLYIYAFPVQQLMTAAFGGGQLPVLVYVVLCVAATVPLAAELVRGGAARAAAQGPDASTDPQCDRLGRSGALTSPPDVPRVAPSRGGRGGAARQWTR
jgi:peptidoglycan/LPS O-acetylase OafA/YrhL